MLHLCRTGENTSANFAWSLFGASYTRLRATAPEPPRPTAVCPSNPEGCLLTRWRLPGSQLAKTGLHIALQGKSGLLRPAKALVPVTRVQSNLQLRSDGWANQNELRHGLVDLRASLRRQFIRVPLAGGEKIWPASSQTRLTDFSFANLLVRYWAGVRSPRSKKPRLRKNRAIGNCAS
jgi:hypothetical protein